MFWKLSEGYQENTLGGVIFVQEPEILLKEEPYYRRFLSWEIFENGWPLTATSEQLGTVAFDIFQFLTIAISFSF